MYLSTHIIQNVPSHEHTFILLSCSTSQILFFGAEFDDDQFYTFKTYLWLSLVLSQAIQAYQKIKQELIYHSV